MSLTISVLYPGMMGASLASRLHHVGGFTILTDLEGRSKSTLDRAAKAGMKAATFTEMVTSSNYIFSVLPPSEAVTLVQKIVAEIKSDPPNIVFFDGNAISPATNVKIASTLFKYKIPYVAGSIIGGPAKEDGSYLPSIYLSSGPEYSTEMDTLNDVMLKGGLKPIVLSTGGSTLAKSLKMSYAALTKGSTGLGATVVMRAMREEEGEEGLGAAMIEEMSKSQRPVLERLVGALPSMLPKAYRWVGEMEEISDFLSPLNNAASGATASSAAAAAATAAASPAASSARQIADIYMGMAKSYQRIADAIEEKERSGGGTEDAELIMKWVEMARAKLAEKP